MCAGGEGYCTRQQDCRPIVFDCVAGSVGNVHLHPAHSPACLPACLPARLPAACLPACRGTCCRTRLRIHFVYLVQAQHGIAGASKIAATEAKLAAAEIDKIDGAPPGDKGPPMLTLLGAVRTFYGHAQCTYSH